MANFLQKERIEVQGTGAYAVDNLAKDLGGLMTAVSGTAKTINKSMISESTDIGKALARDAILEAVRLKNEYDRGMADDPEGFDYGNAGNNISAFVPQKLVDVREKLGNDSVAYKAFEDSFLQAGTQYTEEYRTTLFEKHKKVATTQGLRSEGQVINEATNALGEKGIASSYERLTKLGASDDYVSQFTTSAFLGKFNQAEFDAKTLVGANGQIDRAKEIQAFNKFYGSIATMNKDGSIQGKHSFLQQNDLGQIKASWDTKTRIATEKKTYNYAWDSVMNATSNVESQANSGLLTSGEINESIEKVKDASRKAIDLGNTDQSYGQVSERDIGGMNKKLNDLTDAQNVSKVVENDLLNVAISTNEVGDLLKNGKTITMQSANLNAVGGGTIEKHIPASFYQNALNKYQEGISNKLLSLNPADDNSKGSFVSNMATLERLEEISGKKSTFSQKFDKMLDPSSPTTDISPTSINQLSEFIGHKASSGNQYYQKQLTVVQDINKFSQQLKTDSSNKKEVMTNIHNVIQATKVNDLADVRSDTINNVVEDVKTKITKGALWNQGTIFHAEFAENGETAIKQWLSARGSKVSQFTGSDMVTDNFDFYEYHGGWMFGKSDVRVPIPKNSSKDFEKALEVSIKEYNKKKNTNFSIADTFPSVVYNKSIDDFETKILSRKDNDEQIAIISNRQFKQKDKKTEAK